MGWEGERTAAKDCSEIKGLERARAGWGEESERTEGEGEEKKGRGDQWKRRRRRTEVDPLHLLCIAIRIRGRLAVSISDIRIPLRVFISGLRLHLHVCHGVLVVCLCQSGALAGVQRANVFLDEREEPLEVLAGDGRASSVEEVQILVEDLDEQVNLLTHARVRDLQTALQASQHTLVVTVTGLQEHTKHITKERKEAE